ncbi:MAG: hypothetical protein HJJLKODD_02055 [Phycisphaerae bacterium]|nr:hypothetical protein [Phycisphaerae bacterium]
MELLGDGAVNLEKMITDHGWAAQLNNNQRSLYLLRGSSNLIIGGGYLVRFE